MEIFNCDRCRFNPLACFREKEKNEVVQNVALRKIDFSSGKASPNEQIAAVFLERYGVEVYRVAFGSQRDIGPW